ncbi:MAG: hypothetical protein ACOC7T_01880 [Planctomycetota bacterium]
MTARTGISCAVALVVVLALSGCASAPRGGVERHPVWPAPPASPRIAHRLTVNSNADLGEPSFFENVGALFVGRREQKLLRPQGIDVLGDELLLVTDQERQLVHLFELGSNESRVIDRAGDTYLISPVDVAACGDRIAVSDSDLNAVFLFDVEGEMAGRLEKPGGFRRPTGLAWDAQTELLWVVDTLSNEVCAFELSGALRRRFGSGGTDFGQFNYPTYVCVGPGGRIYVTDSLNFRVQAFDRRGNYQFHIGELGDASGYLAVPKGVAVDRHGHIYVADSYFSVIQVFDREGRLLLSFGGLGSGPGQFRVPTGLASDGRERIYVSDSFNRSVQVFDYVGEETNEAPTDAP